MLDIAALRAREEQKVIVALRSLNDARKELQDAISTTEEREHQFRQISDEVRRRLEAIDLVERIAQENGVEIAPSEPEQTADALSKLLVATSSPSPERVVRTSSRAMFPSLRRSKAMELSILP